MRTPRSIVLCGLFSLLAGGAAAPAEAQVIERLKERAKRKVEQKIGEAVRRPADSAPAEPAKEEAEPAPGAERPHGRARAPDAPTVLPELPRFEVYTAPTAAEAPVHSAAADTAAALVARLHGPDVVVAGLAAAELLRLAGIPLVAFDGEVIALPDRYVLADAATYAEFVPSLARAVREGYRYPVEDIAALLAEIGVTDEPLPAPALLAGLGAWGKAAAAPFEAQVAGAAVRALAAQRAQLLFAGAAPDAIDLDPIQVVLLIAHFTSRTGERAPGAAIRTIPPFRFAAHRPLATANPCNALNDRLQQGGQVADLLKEVITSTYKDSVKDMLGPKGQRAFDRASGVYEKGTDVLALLLLYLGVQLDLNDDRGGVTHFKHQPGERDKHVKLTATARFDSTLPNQTIACFNLAGLDIPPSQPLAGYTLRWSLKQKLTAGNPLSSAQGMYLRPIRADLRKLHYGGGAGETTGSNGTSTLELYPPVERKPARGKEQTGTVTVTASLDKDDFPFKLADMLKLREMAEGGKVKPSGAYTIAADKIYDFAKSAAGRLVLPSRTREVTVKFHGADIYAVQENSYLWLFYVALPLVVDVVSCEGLEGQWQGRGGFTKWDVTILGRIAARLVRMKLPENFQMMNEHLRFQLNKRAVENVVDIISYNSLMSAVVRIDDRLVRENRAVPYDYPIGEFRVQMPRGNEISLINNTVYPIKRLKEHPRCEGGGFEYEDL